MTTKFNKFALATTALFSLGLAATSATAAPATANATATAKVLKQLTITKSTDLNFGTIVGGTAQSTVAIDAAGARTCGAGLTCSGAVTSAAFSVTGTNNTIVKLSTPNTSVVLTSTTNATDKMTAVVVVPATLNLGNSGNTGGAAFAVGGTLTVGAAQADGIYNGAFDVTVDYQ